MLAADGYGQPFSPVIPTLFKSSKPQGGSGLYKAYACSPNLCCNTWLVMLTACISSVGGSVRDLTFGGCGRAGIIEVVPSSPSDQHTPRWRKPGSLAQCCALSYSLPAQTRIHTQHTHRTHTQHNRSCASFNTWLARRRLVEGLAAARLSSRQTASHSHSLRAPRSSPKHLQAPPTLTSSLLIKLRKKCIIRTRR